MLAVSGVAFCGLLPLVAGSLVAVFTKPLARTIVKKDGLGHEIRRRHVEYLLRRWSGAAILLGATIVASSL